MNDDEHEFRYATARTAVSFFDEICDAQKIQLLNIFRSPNGLHKLRSITEAWARRNESALYKGRQRLD
jgi:hypothetical protein